MDKAKRAQTAETLKQPSLRLTLRAPYLYPDRADSAALRKRRDMIPSGKVERGERKQTADDVSKSD
jgi:hypothetical protein